MYQDMAGARKSMHEGVHQDMLHFMHTGMNQDMHQCMQQARLSEPESTISAGKHINAYIGNKGRLRFGLTQNSYIIRETYYIR